MISHFVTFQHFRYFKSAVLISLGASIAYAVHDSGGHPGGGTWLGYVLGSGAVALIAWLAWFGIRKRRFKGYGLVHGWLSAHIYFGLSLLVVATLHTGFRFGWNVHTLAYALMVVVIMSGAFGAIAYSVLPSLALANRGVQSLEGMISEILSIDREVRELSVALDDKLGSLLADVPHTRPIPVTLSAGNTALAKRFDVEMSRYEGPTGILGAIQDACNARDIDSVSLWAAIPHYVSTPPCPKATLALLNHLEDLLQLNIPEEELPDDARAWELGATQITQEDSEISEYVQSLEETKDAADLPEASGESIAREFERYLRHRGEDPK